MDDKYTRDPQDQLPDILYKYRFWNNEKNGHDFDRLILTHDIVYFTSARNLNDPFDCKLPLRYDLLSEEQHFQKYKELIASENPHLNARDVDAQAWEWMKIYDPEVIKSREEELIKDRDEGYGILSLSAVRDNILMWSHYSDSHKGFCIGLGTKKLDSFFGMMAMRDKVIINPYPVKYCEDENFPILDFAGMNNDEDWHVKQLTMKANNWSYEEEYRFLLIDDTNRPFYLETGIISQVILGCMISAEHKREIVEIMKERHRDAELLQAKKQDDYYGLDFERVDF